MKPSFIVAAALSLLFGCSDATDGGVPGERSGGQLERGLEEGSGGTVFIDADAPELSLERDAAGAPGPVENDSSDQHPVRTGDASDGPSRDGDALDASPVRGVDDVGSKEDVARAVDVFSGPDGAPDVESLLPGDADAAFDSEGQGDTESVAPEDADVASGIEDTGMLIDGVQDTPGAQEVGDVALGEGSDGATDIGPDLETVDIEVAEEDTDALSDAPDGEPMPPKPLYLLSINNTTDTLEKIDVQTGMGTDLCELDIAIGYPSLTFSRDNVLFASRGGTALDVIDPCTCEVTPVASYGGYSGVNGITSDQGLNLFGVASTQDAFITISTSVGLAQSVGPLGVDFGSSGATWSEDDQTVYAINSSDDVLYEITPETGVATMIAPLSLPFGTVGIEMHPDNGVLYACSSDAILLEVDTMTGEVTEIGHTGQEGSCSNLAAPWKVVPCLE